MSMPSDSPSNGEVRITIKDLYMAQRQYESRLADSDKKLSELMTDLRVTLIGIQTHIANVDTRNAAADELHREHGRRLSEMERVVDSSGVRSLREDRASALLAVEERHDRLESRIQELESKAMSSVAVNEATRQASAARTLARQTFWLAVAGIVALVGLIVTLISVRGHL